MKSLSKNLLLLAGMVSLSFLFSCGGDETEDPTAAPSLTVSASKTAYTTEDTVSFDVTYDVPGEFGGFNYSFSATEGTEEISFTKKFLSPSSLDGVSLTETSGSFTFKPFGDEKIADLDLKVGGAAYTLAGKSVTFKFEILNASEDAQADSVEVTFKVEESIDEFTAVLIGGQLNSTYGSFYDATGDKVYKVSEAAQNNSAVDFVYYFLNTETNPNTAIIASADNPNVQTTFEANSITWPLTTENSTKFKASDKVFADIKTSSQVASAYSEVGDDLDRIVGLAVGQVVAFQLDDSKGSLYGVFEVKSIDGTGGPDRSITINVKVQK